MPGAIEITRCAAVAMVLACAMPASAQHLLPIGADAPVSAEPPFEIPSEGRLYLDRTVLRRQGRQERKVEQPFTRCWVRHRTRIPDDGSVGGVTLRLIRPPLGGLGALGGQEMSDQGVLLHELIAVVRNAVFGCPVT